MVISSVFLPCVISVMMTVTPTTDVKDMESTQWGTSSATIAIAVFGIILVLFVILMVACVNMSHNEGQRYADGNWKIRLNGIRRLFSSLTIENLLHILDDKLWNFRVHTAHIPCSSQVVTVSLLVWEEFHQTKLLRCNSVDQYALMVLLVQVLKYRTVSRTNLCLFWTFARTYYLAN